MVGLRVTCAMQATRAMQPTRVAHAACVMQATCAMRAAGCPERDSARPRPSRLPASLKKVFCVCVLAP
ncbi:hypothetical protein HMPREF1008_00909 [Olsenella sp. oral taxon 809 str. F0356]|nr:hypothetical protein HMPREF1008_00909 [Olsenella sp. oral taxon 809 str. F0356]